MALLLLFHSIPGYRREQNPPQVILVTVLKIGTQIVTEIKAGIARLCPEGLE